jgi:hypothetical protein
VIEMTVFVSVELFQGVVNDVNLSLTGESAAKSAQELRQRLISFWVGIFLNLAHQIPLSFSIPQMHSRHFAGRGRSGS